jgi:hypothetical protein
VRDRRVESVDAIREGGATTRPVRDYLEALDAGNPVHQGDARYLSPTDPAASWNTKEGRGKFLYFNNYLVDTDHAVIIDVEATPGRIAQEIVATRAMLERVEETHGLRPERLAADKAYGTGSFLGWLSERKIIPHIPVPVSVHTAEAQRSRRSHRGGSAGGDRSKPASPHTAAPARHPANAVPIDRLRGKQ